MHVLLPSPTVSVEVKAEHFASALHGSLYVSAIGLHCVKLDIIFFFQNGDQFGRKSEVAAYSRLTTARGWSSTLFL
jgi:hypothetical protein